MTDVLAPGLAVGCSVIIDGKLWEITDLAPPKCSAERIDDDSAKTLRVSCDARELTHIGSDIYGLPGRIEVPTVPEGVLVADVAVADVRAG